MKKSGAQILPWSFSRLTDWERCPFYAYEVHVNKNKKAEEDDAPWKIKGNAWHQAAQIYVNDIAAGVKRSVPKELKHYSQEIKQLLKMAKATPQTELQQAFDKNWKPVAWYGDNVYMRMIIDLVVLHASGINVVDYKTGKIYQTKTEDQLRLYAVGGFALQPMAPEVRAEAWHLDLPPQTGLMQFKVMPKQALTVRKDFERRVIKMASDKKLTPTPNAGCKWCHLAKSKGGPCPINI